MLIREEQDSSIHSGEKVSPDKVSSNSSLPRKFFLKIAPFPRGSVYPGKRSFDMVCSFLGLIVLSPLLLVLAIVIKLGEPTGPIFYSQIRIGYNNQPFRIYKFRSMCVDADSYLPMLQQYNEMDGPMFKMRKDPRVTKIGSFMRKLNLDELPQLWNVLKGDMSLVGPRPALPEEVSCYQSDDLKRLQVPPGCSGLWQVSTRTEHSFQEMLEMDLEYMANMSFSTDIIIILKTVGLILRPLIKK